MWIHVFQSISVIIKYDFVKIMKNQQFNWKSMFFSLSFSHKAESKWELFKSLFNQCFYYQLTHILYMQLYLMPVYFSSEVWIDWLQCWCSCCVSDDHQKLLWSWKLWLISQFVNWLASLIKLALSVAVIVLKRSFTRQEIDWHEIWLHVWYVCKLIIKMLIEQKFEWFLFKFNFARKWKTEKH